MPKSPNSFVDAIGKAVDAASLNHAAYPRRKISAIVDGCGWKARSVQRMADLQTALESAGLFPSLNLLDPYLGLDTWIKFGRKPFPTISNPVIDQERALTYYLSLAPERLTEAIPLLGRLRHISGGVTPQRRYWLQGKGYIPDLIFETSKRDWVVCEVELGPPKHESVSQLMGYIDAVGNAEKRGTIGILLTANATSDGAREDTALQLSTLSAEGRRVHWLAYDFLRLAVVPI